MMIRTKHQAEVEALRRWGRYGTADLSNASPGGSGELRLEVTEYKGHRTYFIGRLHVICGIAMQTSICSSGVSWQDAFDRYDREQRKNALFREWEDQPCPLCSRTMRTGYGPLKIDVLAGARAKGRKALAEARRKYDAHWPCIVSLDVEAGAAPVYEVMCISCKHEHLVKALTAWGEALRGAVPDARMVG
jgi:hypothetical protein